MKPERDLRKAMRARFNQARKHMHEVTVLLDTDPDEIEPGEIGDLRNSAEQFIQCVHEFSAYWNILKT